MNDPSPTIPPFIPTGPTDEGLPGQIVWDRECIYTFDGAHWGRTPRAVSSGAWDDLYTPEGGPSARFLLASKPQSLTDREKEQAQLNIGLLPATTESFGIVRYTDSWMDNGSGDPGDYPVTLTRHAIMELIGNKLVAGTSNVTVAYDVATGNTSISVSGGGGGGGEPFDGHLNADLVIGHGIVGTKAEWSVPLGDLRHEGRIDETSGTEYSVAVGVKDSRTVEELVDDINNHSSLGFIVEAVKVSDSELKLVAREPGTVPNGYTFKASASVGVEQPCFGTGNLTRSVNGTTTTPASTYTATLNGKPMLSTADIARRVTAYGQNPVSSEGVFRALYDKQDKLEWDATPTANSTKPVYSGGVYTALQGKQNTLTWDASPTAGSPNALSSDRVYSALHDADLVIGRGGSQAVPAHYVATPLAEYDGMKTYRFLCNLYQQSENPLAVFTWLPGTGTTVQDFVNAVNNTDNWRDGVQGVSAVLDGGKVVLSCMLEMYGGEFGNLVWVTTEWEHTSDGSWPFVVPDFIQLSDGAHEVSPTDYGVSINGNYPLSIVGGNAKVSVELLFDPPTDPMLGIFEGAPGGTVRDVVHISSWGQMLTANNVEEWVAWLNSGAEGTLEGNALASYADGILTLELLGGYAGLNGNLCFLSREAGSPYEGDHRFSGGADGHGVLKHLHRYAATVPSAGLDLSGVTVETYASAEVWLDCTPSSGLVDWPSDWSWVDGKVPPQSFTQNTRLFIDVVNDGRAVVANFKYYYTYA